MTSTHTPREELTQAIGSLVTKSLMPDSPFRELLEAPSYTETTHALEQAIGSAVLNLRVGTKDAGFYLGVDRMIGNAARTGGVGKGALHEYLSAIDAQVVELSEILGPSRENVKLRKAPGAGTEQEVYG